MIRVFRQLRKAMIAKNKTTRYLLYAIGEIALVVIGILIALQVNTWNEDRQRDELETKILQEIHSNLVLDLAELQSDADFMDLINEACMAIQNYLETNETASDSLFTTLTVLRITPHFDPVKSGYGLLQSKGVEVISNDSLRNKISVLYEQAYPYYRRYEEERLAFHAQHSEPILLKYFNMNFEPNSKDMGEFKVSGEDYKKLREDDLFNKLLSAIAFENTVVQNRARRTETGIKNLLGSIEKELETKGQPIAK